MCNCVYLGYIKCCKKDVCRFDVPMHHPETFQILQRAAEMVTPIENQLLREEAILNYFLLDTIPQVSAPADNQIYFWFMMYLTTSSNSRYLDLFEI